MVPKWYSIYLQSDKSVKQREKYILPERPPIMNDAFHLDRAFCDAWRRNLQGWQARESCKSELVALVAITPAQFLFGNWVSAGCQRQTSQLLAEC